MNENLFSKIWEQRPVEDILPFRMIGSKYNLIWDIYKILNNEGITGHSFCDLFSGSGVVGRFFKKMYSIISNDSLYYSYVLQRGLITINNYPSFSNLKDIATSIEIRKRIEQVLQYLNNLSGVKGFIYQHYTPASKDIDGIERKYFSIENGMKIDGVRQQIEKWFQENKITEDEYFYLLTSLLFAVQKVSNISGHYDAFNKFWDQRTYKPLTLKYIDVITSKFTHKAYNEDVFNLIDKISCDIAYLDPPYNTRQYITNYHILETIAKYDNPKIKGITGIRADSDKKKSPFAKKRTVENAFAKLLNDIKAKYIILSYNNEGLLSKDQLIQLFKNSGISDLKFYEISYRKFKSNSKVGKNKVIEYLFIGKRSN